MHLVAAAKSDTYVAGGCCKSCQSALGVAVQAMYKVAIMKGSTDADSIGQHICHSAEQLRAAAVVMAAHNKGKAVKWLVGSTMQYCMHQCHQTLLCMHL